MGLVADLKYPFNEDEWWKTIGTGMVCEYFTWLIMPGFVLAGYYIRVMRHTAAGHEEPPTFEEPMSLVGDGLRVLFILGVYLLIPTVVAAMVFIPALLAILEGQGGGLTGLLVALLITSAVTLFFAYGGVAGVVQFSHTGSIASAFHPDLLEVVLSGSWIAAWIKVIITSSFASIVSVLIALTGIGALAHIVLVPFQVKYFSTVYARIFANGYADATG
jgi:hypothetical protein